MTDIEENPTVLDGDPDRVRVEGINALGPFEQEIMQLMWQLKESTIPEIYKIFRMRDKDEAIEDEVKYTTILTTMTRLVKKGYLNQDRSNITFTYTVARQPDEVADAQALKMMEVLVEHMGETRVKRALRIVTQTNKEETAQQ